MTPEEIEWLEWKHSVLNQLPHVPQGGFVTVTETTITTKNKKRYPSTGGYGRKR